MKLRVNLNKLAASSGQSVLEYALVAAIVAAAMVTMSTYVFRSVQATQQTVTREFGNN